MIARKGITGQALSLLEKGKERMKKKVGMMILGIVFGIFVYQMFYVVSQDGLVASLATIVVGLGALGAVLVFLD